MDKNHFSQIETTKNVKSFGFLADGKEILCYTLSNKNGCEVSVINYGATITSIKIPVSKDKKIDVALGFETLEDYINSYYLPSPPYFGTTVGRYAGRIKNAGFSLNGKQIFLNKNHGEHNIHGGILGFGRKFWNAVSISFEENPSIILEYISEDGEENFPGELTIQLTYTLTEENELKVSFLAKSNEDTIVNLTQHSYFNLDGHSNDIANQKIIVNSNKVLETTDELIPTGEFVSLRNHAFDFSSAKFCPVAIDNTFVLENDTSVSELAEQNAATLISEKNRLKMTVTTNQPAVHIYVGGNCFGKITSKENTNYHNTSGICFETQNFPDAPNHNNFPNAVLRKGEEYNHQTTFKFENI
jgi:aldose 1-epimerase